MEHVIRTDRVSKFIQGKPIVFRLSLEIPRGTLYGLLGPNGAGKSTTLKLLTGRLKPSSGSIEVLGMDPWRDRVEVNRRVGYLPQNPSAHAEKQVLDFLTYMGRLQGFHRLEARSLAREALYKVGLGRFEENIIGKLSGGETQRLGFANALLGDPDILFLDEPTASLDPEGRVYVMDLIQRLARDESKTIIISSHILPEIQRMTNYVAIMSEGSVLTSGNINALTTDIFDTEYVIRANDPERLAALLSERDIPAHIEKDRIYIEANGGLEEIWSLIPQICSENGIQLRSFHPVRDSLEQLFLKLVSNQKEETNNNE